MGSEIDKVTHAVDVCSSSTECSRIEMHSEMHVTIPCTFYNIVMPTHMQEQ